MNNEATLNREVNVMVWSQDATATGVLESAELQSAALGLRTVVSPTGGANNNGWASFAIRPKNTTPNLFVFDKALAQGTALAPAATAAAQATYGSWQPLMGDTVTLGMAVWQRNFGSNAAANYGRAVEHSYILSSGMTQPNQDF